MDTQSLNSLKQNLIVRIEKSDDAIFLHHIKDEFDELENKRPTEQQLELLKKLSKPIREKTNLEGIIREQNWKPSTPEEIDEIIKNFDWQISLEELKKELQDI